MEVGFKLGIKELTQPTTSHSSFNVQGALVSLFLEAFNNESCLNLGTMNTSSISGLTLQRNAITFPKELNLSQV